MTNKDLTQQVFEDLGYDVRAYSGRAMYGEKCLGVTFDGDIGKLVSDLVAHTVNLDPHEVDDLADALRAMRTDSMGLSQVAYFPRIHFTEAVDGDAPNYREATDEDLDRLATTARRRTFAMLRSRSYSAATQTEPERWRLGRRRQ